MLRSQISKNKELQEKLKKMGDSIKMTTQQIQIVGRLTKLENDLLVSSRAAEKTRVQLDALQQAAIAMAAAEAEAAAAAEQEAAAKNAELEEEEDAAMAAALES